MRPSQVQDLGSASFLRRLVRVREDEVFAMLWSWAYFFFILASCYVIRPIRDERALAAGVQNLPWLFLATLLVMLILRGPTNVA